MGVFPLYFTCEKAMKINGSERQRQMYMRLHKKKCALCRAEAKEEYGSRQKFHQHQEENFDKFHEEGHTGTRAMCVDNAGGKSYITTSKGKYHVEYAYSTVGEDALSAAARELC